MLRRSWIFPVIAAGLFALPATAQQKPVPAQPPKPTTATAPPAATTPAIPVTPTSPVPGLPGGASSLTEQHGDWSVSCSVVQGAKQCTFSQSLGNTQTGKREFSIQLRPAGDDKVGGLMMTPFALRLEPGIRLAVDDKPLAGPLPFLTCVESGCVVPLSFDSYATAMIKAGTALKFSATSINEGQSVNYTISLAGFLSAWNRTTDLLK